MTLHGKELWEGQFTTYANIGGDNQPLCLIGMANGGFPLLCGFREHHVLQRIPKCNTGTKYY